jgi:hypothetical protein
MIVILVPGFAGSIAWKLPEKLGQAVFEILTVSLHVRGW